MNALLEGEKGCGLPEYGLGHPYAGGRGAKARKSRIHGKGKGVQKQENPVARLKLLLVRSLHSRLVWGLILLTCWEKNM